MVCLITTGDAAGVAQVGKWRLGPQSFAAALTVTRRFPVVADDLPAAVGSLALRGENELYGVIEQGLWSLLGGGRVEWWARRSPKEPRKKGHPAELVGLSPRDVDAVESNTGEMRLFDLCVEAEALVEAFAIAFGVERSDPAYQIWSEALARTPAPRGGGGTGALGAAQADRQRHRPAGRAGD